MAESKKFEIIKQTHDLLELEKNGIGSISYDTMVHKVKCKECNELFELWCCKYNGRGSFKRDKKILDLLIGVYYVNNISILEKYS